MENTYFEKENKALDAKLKQDQDELKSIIASIKQHKEREAVVYSIKQILSLLSDAVSGGADSVVVSSAHIDERDVEALQAIGVKFSKIVVPIEGTFTGIKAYSISVE